MMRSVCFNLHWFTSFIFVSKVKVIMPNKGLDIMDKVLMKCMDVLELLTNISEDLTIEDLKKSEISTKTIRKDIFYRLVVIYWNK